MCTFLQIFVHSLSWLDLLDAVVLNPLEMVADAAAYISGIVKDVLSSFTEMFKGVEGTEKKHSNMLGLEEKNTVHYVH